MSISHGPFFEAEYFNGIDELESQTEQDSIWGEYTHYAHNALTTKEN
jgi:hypothetical protein